MSRLVRSSLLLGVAVLSLAACSSSKGPGEIGSKDDIVVRNNGLPQPKQAEAAPATQGGDFSSTVEQGEAIPAPEVASAQPLPDNSPAMEQAVKAQEEATAPLPSTATSEATNSAIPADPATNPIDAVAPVQPVAACAMVCSGAKSSATRKCLVKAGVKVMAGILRRWPTARRQTRFCLFLREPIDAGTRALHA